MLKKIFPLVNDLITQSSKKHLSVISLWQRKHDESHRIPIPIHNTVINFLKIIVK